MILCVLERKRDYSSALDGDEWSVSRSVGKVPDTHCTRVWITLIIQQGNSSTFTEVTDKIISRW